ncbi:(2Fe-2S) ferredoxin domain-containing protein [Derxia gummosa]|uniref:(2Fe-2S) ferredoxin domain-containing protein n=1 Tax=Derxia gummosa DSM 723 TaxID=1121388 RepID=A0A8B6X2V8_9BURK|nr:NAD(P)H-dependent oxidoreductase subunit E [Derxia gummosa]
MSYFKRHMFICTNQRDKGEACCAAHDAQAMVDHAKKRVKAAGVGGEGGVRVQKAGCLGRCDDGPVAVVYPEGTWYTFIDKTDIDEIVDSHLVGGTPVDRLKV